MLISIAEAGSSGELLLLEELTRELLEREFSLEAGMTDDEEDSSLSEDFTLLDDLTLSEDSTSSVPPFPETGEKLSSSPQPTRNMRPKARAARPAILQLEKRFIYTY